MTNTVSLTWLDDGAIAKIVLPNARRETVDSWAETSRGLFTTWEPQKPYLLLQDMRSASPTPYGNQVIAQLIEDTPPHISGRIANIVPASFFAQVIQTTGRSLTSQIIANIEFNYFQTEENAHQWLKEYQKPSS